MQEDEVITPIYFEKILLKFIFNDLDVREKILPFLDSEIFDGFETKDLVKVIIKFIDEYSKFPTIPELKFEISNKESYDCLLECLDINIDEYDRDFILEKIEEFFKRKMILNELVNANIKLSQDSVDSLNDVPDKIREKLSFSFDTDVGLDVFSDKGKEAFYDHLHSKDKTFSTGISYIDRVIDGGFHEKTLNLYLGSPGSGKTKVLCSQAVNSLLQNNKVLYLTLEMCENKINERILANILDVEIGNLKKLSKEEYCRKFDKVFSTLKSKLIIKEFPAKSLNANRIRNLLKELKTKKNFVPDIIIVDYLGLMIPNNLKLNSNSYETLKIVSEELRAIAQEYGQPVLSAIQTNRDGIGASEIDLTDVADSIGITATADLIIGLIQNDEYREACKYCFIILKNRYGINGTKFNVCEDVLKMRIYSDPEEEEKSKNYKPVKSNSSNVDDAAVDIIKGIKKEKKTKLQEMMNPSLEIEM